MPQKPDQIINKTAKKTQNILFGVAVFFGLLGLGGLSNGSGSGLAFLFLAGLIGWGASKIKTTYNWIGGTDVYK